MDCVPSIAEDLVSYPPGYWHQIEHHRNFLNWVANRMDIRQMRNWKMVRLVDIGGMNGWGFLDYYRHSLHRALEVLYPEEDMSGFAANKSHT